MKKLRHSLLAVLWLAPLLAACATGGYWVPPPNLPSAQPGLELPTGTPTVSPTVAVQEPAVDGTPAPEILPVDLGPTEVIPDLPEDQPDPVDPPTPTPTEELPLIDNTPILYTAQAADSLRVVAIRFGVQPEEIQSPEKVPQEGFINPGQLLVIPRRLANTTSSQQLLPDSELVFSPSGVGFDITAFVQEAGGYLSTDKEWLKSTGVASGGNVLMRVAVENSINPRLLLGLLEYQSGWVYGQPQGQQQKVYPLGKVDLAEKGLYNQLVWALNQLSIGYYAYREGRLTEIHFPDGMTARLAPDLNAGTAALQYYFAQIYQGQQWLDAIDPIAGFPALYTRMFGDPWQRARGVEPLYPPDLTQPPLILPFQRDWPWSYTGGPHGAWERDGAFAALDFAPGTTVANRGCKQSNTWAMAAASGLVVRSGNGVVVLDLDGDGMEQTGWVLLYLHLSTNGRIPVGSWVDAGDPLGHPSCEGGMSTGTHLHIARKFNGEWIPAAGPLPFNLSGWVAQAGPAAYKGTLTRNGQTLTACTCSSPDTFIARSGDDP